MNQNLLYIQEIDQVDSHLLDKFFLECKRLGYNNNISLDTIRLSFVKEKLGNIWCILKNNNIVGMAGCHLLTSKSFRILFRGCELPGQDIKQGLSRAHFNSMCFRELIPIQLNWIENCGYDKNDVYLSVNLNNKNHRAMEILETQGFLTKEHDYKSNLILFDTPQTLWKFNTLKYETERLKIKTYSINLIK